MARPWRRWRALVLTLALFGWLCGGAAPARADTCTATLTDISFAAVSPISASDYFATGTGSLKCVWSLTQAPLPLLYPNVSVCVNAGLGSNATGSTPRTMGNGALRLDYNLFRNGSYTAADIWGAPGLGSTITPYSYTLQTPNLVTGGTTTMPFTVYAKISAGAALAGVKTVGNSDTLYSASFSGFGTVSYAFYLAGAPACTTGSSTSFAFNVQATVVNNCTITSTPMQFGNYGVLNAPVRSTSTLSVQCVNANAYQIALNGGTTSGSAASRQMKKTTGSETVAYSLSATLDGTLWGDGTGGTTLYAGTGSGAAAALTIYGMVPAQGTPSPGDYKDTVTATIYF